ncbi:replication initiation protein, partial [Acinetobacter lwoffii]
IDFYNLEKKNQAKNGFELTIDEMFTDFGLPESYRDLRNLKRRVLKSSLDEINEFTDVTVDYSPVKNGRSVVGFKFTVKENSKPKLIAP